MDIDAGIFDIAPFKHKYFFLDWVEEHHIFIDDFVIQVDST